MVFESQSIFSVGCTVWQNEAVNDPNHVPLANFETLSYQFPEESNSAMHETSPVFDVNYK